MQKYSKKGARMTAFLNKIFSLFLAMFTVSGFFASNACADCYSDCINAEGCGIAGFNDSVSCGHAQVRCSTECRDGGAARQSYGAIAYSTQTGAYGYSDDWDNQAQAEQTAMRYCNENGYGCEIMVWFYNSCGAVAADAGSGAAAWGQNSSETEAKRIALENCTQSGGQNCEIKVSHCSN
jgi:hypothetical protein